MSKINEVFTSKEMERKIGMSNQHIRRLVNERKVELINGIDYRKTEEKSYLYTDTAWEKFLEYTLLTIRAVEKRKSKNG